MTEAKTPIVETSLKTGVLWNLASLGFLALSGLFLNFAIARFYSPEILGVFNIVFAIYIFASQMGTFGIHFSLLRSTSEYSETGDPLLGLSALSGLIAITIISTGVSLITLLAAPLISSLMAGNTEQIKIALYCIIPGLWAFSINKGLLNIVNGLRHMRAFAIFQSTRYVIVLISFAIFTYLGTPGELLTLIFTVAELLLLPIVGIYCWRKIPKKAPAKDRSWYVKHLIFGSKIFLSGAILELNTRIDVLMLGALVSPKAAGLYSIAALIAEGLAQAIFAIRNNINPLITRLVASSKVKELEILSRKTILYFTPFIAVLSIIAYFVFPYFVKYFLADMQYLEASTPLIILLGAITLSSGFMVFNMMFSQAGRPGLHTIYCLLIMISNIILNSLLIPSYGINGAAMATSGAYILSIIMLWIFSRKFLGVKLAF